MILRKYVSVCTPSVEAGSPLRYALMEGDPMKPNFELKLGWDRFVAK
jgi:hypothetical protein